MRGGGRPKACYSHSELNITTSRLREGSLHKGRFPLHDLTIFCWHRETLSALDKLLLAAKKCQKLVIFTGSGLSAASGDSHVGNLICTRKGNGFDTSTNDCIRKG